MPGVEQRRHPRYHTETEVIVYLGTGTVTGHISQISRGGCLIFPALPPQSNPAIRMSFRLSEELPYINCKGEIVYSITDRGTGVAFREISQYNQELITEFFEKRLSAEKATGA